MIDGGDVFVHAGMRTVSDKGYLDRLGRHVYAAYW
jgi:hypothetical protein